MDRFNHIFARYGIQLNQDMIMSSDLNAVSIDAATISMVIADHPICEGIDETVVLSQCSSLNVTDGAEIILSLSLIHILALCLTANFLAKSQTVSVPSV